MSKTVARGAESSFNTISRHSSHTEGLTSCFKIPFTPQFIAMKSADYRADILPKSIQIYSLAQTQPSTEGKTPRSRANASPDQVHHLLIHAA
jgi:hypothetical protein